MAWICRPILRFLLFVIVLEFVACYLICLRGSNADFWIFDPRNAFSSLFWLFVRLSVVLQPLFLRLCMAVLFGILLMCNEVCNFSQFSLFDFSRCPTFLRLLYKSNFRDVPIFWDFLCKSDLRDVPLFWDFLCKSNLRDVPIFWDFLCRNNFRVTSVLRYFCTELQFVAT